jgi:Tfp pilus assembly protein PilN
MIKINLLQQEGGGRAMAGSSVPAPGGGTFLVAGILLAAFVVILGYGGFRFVTWQADVARTQEVRSKNEALGREITQKEEQFEELQELERVLKNQIALLETLDPPDRLFWAEKLNLLPLYIPDGVFLTTIRVTESSREVETSDSRRRQDEWRRKPSRSRGPQPAQEFQTVITQQLVLEGVSYVAEGTSDDRLALIATFLRDLQNKEVTSPSTGESVMFMENFRDINYSDIEGVTLAGRECSKFAFTLRARPIGGS